MQISEAAEGQPALGAEPCRFPKLEECAHFHYERVRLPTVNVSLRTNMDQSLHSQHTNEDSDAEWYMIQVMSGEECWLLQRNFENFKMLDAQLHQCIFDRKISQLPDLSVQSPDAVDIETILMGYLERLSKIADNSLNCGPVLNWLQMDNKGHRLLVPSEESRSINTPAVAAAYSVRRYVSQARDELNLEVGDMISVIDMASPGESMWWRGKRGFQVGFFPQHCVHIIGDKVPRNMPLPPPVVGSLAITSIKPVLRKHGKLITFFRSFILNRPSRRRLKQTGILKERVFACDLGEHLLNSGHDIPMVLKCCAEFIEKNGIVDGIYRLSGVTSNIQKLRNAFDEDRIPNLYTDEILQDIHSVASLLKMYFRELPNPLCTYQLYQSFVNAVQNTGPRGTDGDHDRLLKMREAVQKLPPPHYRTLEYLMRHLARVAKHGASTGMTTRNVAIVWAPNLLRCAELEDGGVTALQGVGVQAVVTEFLICFADLIFCDHLPNLDKPLLETNCASSPKKSRPKSLAISTPTKLITLEEARSKHLLSNRHEECNYIEVGGGPKNLPKKYHTIIELPSGTRKRGHTKRSPLGWRSFFSKSRNPPQTALKITRKSSTPGISTSEKSITTVEPELVEVRRKLRSVKSAESLTSGHSEPGPNDLDVLGPLHSLHKPPGHNRSISHDSYFDMLQNSQNNSEGSLLDLSEIQLNFDLEETEMRIFSEDESLVSSPKVHRESGQRRVLTRARPEEFNSAANSGNPSPKKQARVVLSPDALSRKRTRLEDQLSDIQFIDCNTPDNVATITTTTTTAIVHSEDAVTPVDDSSCYQPQKKSPRNSDNLDKRQSLNLEKKTASSPTIIVKSFTDNDIGRRSSSGATPQSPSYRRLGESSTNTTTDSSPTEITYQNLPHGVEIKTEHAVAPKNAKVTTPTYENVLTTISITYKSPPRSIDSSPLKAQAHDFDSIYEDVTILPEKAMIPTSTASLPIQQASQPELREAENYLTLLLGEREDRPKSLSALDNVSKEDTRVNFSSNAVYDTNEQLSMFSAADELKTFSSNRSSRSNVQYTPSSTSTPYNFIDNPHSPATDLSLSEVLHSSSSTDNLNTSQTSISFPVSSKSITPNVSPTPLRSDSLDDLLTPLSPQFETRNTSECSLLQEIQSEVMECQSQRANHAPYEMECHHHSNPAPYDVECSHYSNHAPNDVECHHHHRSNLAINNDVDLIDCHAPSDNNLIDCHAPNDVDLIDFSPSIDAGNAASLDIEEINESSLDKRKSEVIDDVVKDIVDDDVDEEEGVYEQVKYFRRSIHEVNALLELGSSEIAENARRSSSGDNVEKMEDTPTNTNEELLSVCSINVPEDIQVMRGEEEVAYDSLEAEDDCHVYENLLGEDMRNGDSGRVYENVERQTNVMSEDKVSVKDLLVKFEECKEEVQVKSTNIVVGGSECCQNVIVNREAAMGGAMGGANNRQRKFYERDSLPPCLRARNLKHQIKTRSLDDEEFKKEFSLAAASSALSLSGGDGGGAASRRKSMDESMGYKTNSLPKMLNQPKLLPTDGCSHGEIDSLHMTHSSENIARGGGEEDLKKRERIEKYKEERRKILQEKYRTESFKEDKDVLMSRMKIYKPPNREDSYDDIDTILTRTRRKSTRSDDSIAMEEETAPKTPSEEEETEIEEVSDNNDELRLKVVEVERRREETRETEKINATSQHSVKSDCVKSESVKSDSVKSDSVKSDPFKSDSVKSDSVKSDSVKSDYVKSDSLKSDYVKSDSVKSDSAVLKPNSLRARAAVFERNTPGSPSKLPKPCKKSVVVVYSNAAPASKKDHVVVQAAAKENKAAREFGVRDSSDKAFRESFILRSKQEDIFKSERRRHTYDSRERQTESERLRRGSLEHQSPRKEKAASSPTYCIKDMKAIFESKSKQ